jgi:hypothetical protein
MASRTGTAKAAPWSRNQRGGPRAPLRHATCWDNVPLCCKRFRPSAGSANARQEYVSAAQAKFSSSMRVLEPFPECVGLRRSTEVERPEHRERRRRMRADVHWAVHFVRHPSRAPIKSVTDNLSSEGFYCRCDESLVPGEFLECLVFVPTQARSAQGECLGLRCLVQVVRVEILAEGLRSGIGFHIEDYLVIPPGANAGRLSPQD